ncbi:MAG: HAD-IA family hydrolase [Verrucomicrobia bacterium]|nr:HAD-IA family hydrolase [Verrucomicrobiota bacterium]
MSENLTVLGVSLDAGGTLFEPWPSVGEVYARAAKDAGKGQFSPTDLEMRFRVSWRKRSGFGYDRLAWRNLAVDVFQGLLDESEVDSFFGELYEGFAHPDAWRVYPDVIPALDAWRDRGIPVCVTSNWDERLLPLIERLGWMDRFESVIASGVVGFHKPDRRLFQEAARVLKLPPAAILHVGDSGCEDHQGALAAGLQARWLRRGAQTVGLGKFAIF